MTEEQPRTRGRVMLVDDDAAQRRLLQLRLEEEGFEVLAEKSGEDCLARVQQLDPDVLLLDINMPGLDGIETCRRVKRLPELHDLPVVFVTGARDDDPTILEALQAGGNDFVSKDASTPVLMTRVRCQVIIGRSQRRLKHIAMTDELTGLFSRRYLFDALRRVVKSVQRASPRGVACLLLDLDHFKTVNDTLGHLEGDEALKKVAAVIRSATRESDICGRFGGEEFVVVLADVDESGARVAAEKIRAAIERQCAVSVSIGVALAGPVTLETLRRERALDDVVQKLVHDADLAMYASKAAGRNRVTFFTPALADRIGK